MKTNETNSTNNAVEEIEEVNERTEHHDAESCHSPNTDYVMTNDEYNADLKERMELNDSAKLVAIENLPRMGFEELYNWLMRMTRYGNVSRTMLIFQYEDGRIRLHFYTHSNVYTISASFPKNYPYSVGYLGCTVSDRKSRPGEDWNRGSDLPDGDYSEKTWLSILNGIIGYEMKNLQCWR